MTDPTIDRLRRALHSGGHDVDPGPQGLDRIHAGINRRRRRRIIAPMAGVALATAVVTAVAVRPEHSHTTITTPPPQSSVPAATTPPPPSSTPPPPTTGTTPGSSIPPSTGPPNSVPSSTTPSSTTLSRCHTTDLAARLQALPGSAGAGQRFVALVLTNRSARTCTVTGYVGLQLLGASGQPLPTTTARSGIAPPRSIPLPPGGAASTTLHYSVVPGPGDAPTSPCQPVPVALLVTPPDETTQLSVDLAAPPGLGDQGVCEVGHLDVDPLVPGTSGSRG